MDTMLCSRGRILAAILLVVCTVFVNSQQAPRLNVDAKEKVVKGGEQFDFICRAGRPIESCSVKFANLNQAMRVRENTKRDDFEYLGAGFQRGDCGLRYYSIKGDQHGNVTCTVGYPDIDFESIGFTNLIVAVPPTTIELRANNEYKEGEEMRISCQASGARPAPTVTLLLDNNTLATSAKMQDTVNFNRIANFKDNNKRLVCKATHQALEEPKVTEKTLTIFFKPQPANQFGGAIQKFGFFEGQQGIIKVDVFANPQPRLEWKISGEYPDRKNYIPVESNRINQNSETGAWEAELLISEVGQEDLAKEFVLTATNKYGYEIYNVKISFDPTPQDPEEAGFGAGSIVAIIVAVLIVFVAIILTLFARTTGRWCFAERAGRENHSNSEAQFEAEDKTAGNDNPNHHGDEPPHYDVISEPDLKSNGKKADKDTPVPEESSPTKSGGWWGRVTNNYRAVATVEEKTTLPKTLDPKINTAPTAVAETNLDDEESGGVLHSSDTESADRVQAANVPAPRRLFNSLMEKINSIRTPNTKVPSSDEEAKDVEAAEQKQASATAGADGVVYAELEMRKPGEAPVIREPEEKTEYAQIVIPAAAKV